MAVVAVVFRGDTEQVHALLEAIENNCPNKPCHGKCPAHQALLSQRFLDALLFYRWMRERLMAEEWA